MNGFNIWYILSYTQFYTYDNKYTAISIFDIYDIFFIVKEIRFHLEIIEEKTRGNQKCIDTYQQNHVYFVNIACMSIMVALLIVTRMVSQYYICQNS